MNNIIERMFIGAAFYSVACCSLTYEQKSAVRRFYTWVGWWRACTPDLGPSKETP